MDVTMTATLRPDIVDQTLTSFRTHLFGEDPDLRLIVNVDPVGHPKAKTDDVVAVVKKHFGDSYKLNCPKQANFPIALQWCWKQVKSPYFFNLEDDWELLTKVDLADMLLVMDEFPWLAALRLPKRETTRLLCAQSASVREPMYEWNGRFYACPHGRREKMGYYGSPSLIRTYWMKQVLPWLKQSPSPEKQLRRLKRKKNPAVLCWEYGIYSVPNKKRIIADIGTGWRHEHGIRKNSYDKFTTWQSVEADTGSTSSTGGKS